MATSNPFTDDPEKAEVWELGYITGFQDPDGADTFRPFSPELLDVFDQGIDAGHEDRIELSPPGGGEWVPRSELASESTVEMVEHLMIEGLAELTKHVFRKALFGFIGIVITALSIEGDTPLHPLDDDFSEPYTGPEDDPNVSFVAVCPRPDHPTPDVGTTPEGYWAGSPHNDFGDALEEALKHGHSEALVARCSLTDNTCGPVWAAR